jgi:VanZ family protein
MHPIFAIHKYGRTAIVGIVILVLCLLPSDKLPVLNLPFTFMDLVVHFIMFGTLGIAIYLDIIKSYTFKNNFYNVGFAIGISTVFGIITEMLQYLLTTLNRTGNVMDLLFDFLGAAIAVLLIHFIRQKFASAS